MPAEPNTLGPAMSALTERQRAFVQIYIERGGKDVTACFRQAGYSMPAGTSGGNASNLLHNPKVQAAIREVCAVRNASNLPGYYAEMEALAFGKKRGAQGQFQALAALMAHAGVIEPKAAQIVDMKVTHSLADLRRRAVELLADPLLADVGQSLLIEHQPEPEEAAG